MSVMHTVPAERTVETQEPAPWWRLSEIWGAVAITAMWLAVTFVGVYGGDMTFASLRNGCGQQACLRPVVMTGQRSHGCRGDQCGRHGPWRANPDRYSKPR